MKETNYPSLEHLSDLSIEERVQKQINELDNELAARLDAKGKDKKYYQLLIEKQALEVIFKGFSTEKIARTGTVNGVLRSALKGGRSSGRAGRVAELVGNDIGGPPRRRR